MEQNTYRILENMSAFLIWSIIPFKPLELSLIIVSKLRVSSLTWHIAGMSDFA